MTQIYALTDNGSITLQVKLHEVSEKCDRVELKHNLIVDHAILDKGLYTINIDSSDITLDILRSHEKDECIGHLHEFVKYKFLSRRKLDIIVGLIWLSMAPLHPQPLGDFLFYMGKYHLHGALMKPDGWGCNS